MAGPNWSTIEAEYISSDITTAALAEKHGLPAATVRNRCSKGKWKDKRKEARQAAVNGAVMQLQDRAQAEITQVLDVAVSIKDRIQELIKKMGDHLDANEIRSLATALEKIVSVMRAAGRIPTVAEENAQRANIDRLDLERQRLDLERQRLELVKDKGGDGGAEIVIGGEAEDYAD